MLPAARELRFVATAVSVCGRPGFVPDEYLAELDRDELGHPGADPAELAGELCGAGYGNESRAATAYSTRKRSRCAPTGSASCGKKTPSWLAGLPDSAPSEPAVGAAGTTRFGDQVRDRPAASFRCGERGEIAGVVRTSATDSEPTPGREPGAAGGLALDYFLGTFWHADTGDVLDAVQALIEQGNVDPVTMREITWTLWDVTPFYCPECRLNYCDLNWNKSAASGM